MIENLDEQNEPWCFVKEKEKQKWKKKKKKKKKKEIINKIITFPREFTYVWFSVVFNHCKKE